MGTEDLVARAVLGGLGGMDWVSLIALFVIALIYFLAPAAGYTVTSRGLLLASVWLLVVRVAVAVLRVAVLFINGLENKPLARTTENPTFFLLLSLIESTLLLLALILFATGLTSLRRNEEAIRAFQRRILDEE